LYYMSVMWLVKMLKSSRPITYENELGIINIPDPDALIRVEISDDPRIITENKKEKPMNTIRTAREEIEAEYTRSKVDEAKDLLRRIDEAEAILKNLYEELHEIER